MRFKISLLLAVLVAAAALSGTDAGAQAPKFRQDIVVQGQAMPGSINDFFLTFSGPLSVPGVSLARGTYLFRNLSPGVLQVMSADRRATYAMAFTVPVEREVASDRHEVTLGEPVAPGSPQRLVAWWVPGATVGQALIYPK
jgi:hypothetical protein